MTIEKKNIELDIIDYNKHIKDNKDYKSNLSILKNFDESLRKTRERLYSKERDYSGRLIIFILR